MLFLDFWSFYSSKQDWAVSMAGSYMGFSSSSLPAAMAEWFGTLMTRVDLAINSLVGANIGTIVGIMMLFIVISAVAVVFTFRQRSQTRTPFARPETINSSTDPKTEPKRRSIFS
jgi:hypothetical protein